MTVRRARRALAVVLVAVVVLIGLDRAADFLTARKLADDIRSNDSLSHRPKVTIRGFPFLTQVIRGRYQEIDIKTSQPFDSGATTIGAADVALRGIQVSLLDALRGTVRDVPVKSGSGSALVTYAQLNELLPSAVRAVITLSSGGPGHTRISGPLGSSVVVGPEVTNGKLQLVADKSDLDALPDPVQDEVASVLMTPIPLPSFPFNVHLTSGTITSVGLALTATARNSVFPTH